MGKKLTPKQKIFVAEYCVDKNATQAAIRAGYSKKTAGSIGDENLTKPEIAQAIEKHLQKIVQKAGLKTENLIETMRELSDSDIRKLFDDENRLLPFNQWPEDVARCVAAVEVEEIYEWEGTGKNKKKVLIGFLKKIKLWDKNKAVDMANRVTRLYENPEDKPKGDRLIVVENGSILNRL